MATQQKSSKGKTLALWLSAQIIPAAFVVFVSFYLLQKTTMPFELAMPLSIVWGTLGAGIHYLSIKRGMRFRLLMSLLFAVLTVGLAFGLAKLFAIDHSKLKTCPVCGFVTLPAPEQACPLCQVAFKEADAAAEGYDSPHDYLIAAQTMYFMPTAPDTSIDFFGPCNCSEGYQRDPAWKPAVSKQDVLDVQAMTNGK
jgi:hypothetical protein